MVPQSDSLWLPWPSSALITTQYIPVSKPSVSQAPPYVISVIIDRVTLSTSVPFGFSIEAIELATPSNPEISTRMLKISPGEPELGLTEQINDLPREKGAAIILDDTSERIYPLRIRPKLSWHAGSSPSAVPEIKKEIEI